METNTSYRRALWLGACGAGIYAGFFAGSEAAHAAKSEPFITGAATIAAVGLGFVLVLIGAVDGIRVAFARQRAKQSADAMID